MTKQPKLKGKYYDGDSPLPAVDVFAWIADRMIHYGIMWSTNGRICVKDESDEFRTMGLNHLRSIVRRDYLEAHGEFSGLNGIIEDVIMFNRERVIGVDPRKCIHAEVVGRLAS